MSRGLKPMRLRDGEGAAADGGGVSSRGVRDAQWSRAQLSVGRDVRQSGARQLRLQRWDPEPVGAHPEGASAFGVHDLVGNGWEWTVDCVRAVRWIRAAADVSGILGRLLRRRSLRHERRLARSRHGHWCDADSATGSARAIRTSTRRSVAPGRHDAAAIGTRLRLQLERISRPTSPSISSGRRVSFRRSTSTTRWGRRCSMRSAGCRGIASPERRRRCSRVTRATSSSRCRGRSTLTEFGCGNGEKLAVLLDKGGERFRRVHLIDISPAAL